MMNSKKTIIVGNSSFAELIYGYALEDGESDIVGFTVEGDYINNKHLLGLDVMPYDCIEQYYSPEEVQLLLAVGYNRMNQTKKKLYDLYSKKGYRFTNYIHKSSIIASNLELGTGNIIMEGVVLGRNCHLGDGNLIWSGSIVSHDNILGSFNNIGPGTVFAGKCVIGDRNFFGVNSSVINGLSIGNGNLIGAGACVTSDLKNELVYLPHKGFVLEGKKPENMSLK